MIRGGPYIPNEIPKKQRIGLLVFSTLISGYALVGVWRDDLFIFSRRGGAHFHGVSAWLAAGCLLAFSVSMLSTVVDHYDKRNNERSYQRFRGRMQIAACALGLAAIFSPLFMLLCIALA